jgi:hypothetical protein
MAIKIFKLNLLMASNFVEIIKPEIFQELLERFHQLYLSMVVLLGILPKLFSFKLLLEAHN